MANFRAAARALLVGLAGSGAAACGAASTGRPPGGATATVIAAPAPTSGVYVLRAVAGRPLPVAFGDTAGGGYGARQLLAASLTFAAAGDSALGVTVSRPVMLEHWPCAAVRAMRADQAAGRSGGVGAPPAGDSAGAGDCDALRLEHDSAWAAVRRWGADSVELRYAPGAAGDPPTVLRGTVRADTLALDTPYVPAGVRGPTARVVYVRSAPRPSA